MRLHFSFDSNEVHTGVKRVNTFIMIYMIPWCNGPYFKPIKLLQRFIGVSKVSMHTFHWLFNGIRNLSSLCYTQNKLVLQT